MKFRVVPAEEGVSAESAQTVQDVLKAIAHEVVKPRARELLESVAVLDAYEREREQLLRERDEAIERYRELRASVKTALEKVLEEETREGGANDADEM